MKPGFQRWASALVCRANWSWASALVCRANWSWASVLVCGAVLGGCASQRGPDLGATTRLVVAPSAIAVLTPSDARSSLPAELELGGAHGPSALYLKFPSEFRAPQLPRAAFIALSGVAGSAGTSAPVVIEAWRVTSAWDPKQLVTWSGKPQLAPPFARAKLSGGDGADDQRIDVSELVQFAAQHPDLDFGIALVARGGSGRGLSVATGIAGGRAPRLEVYVR